MVDKDWLNIQHQRWRDRAADAWRRAGLRAGQRVLDLGCGPGVAALELAAAVGPAGEVTAVDHAASSLDELRTTAAQAGLTNIVLIQADLDDWSPPANSADLVWMRWLTVFAADPAALVARAAAALIPGGHLVSHEYGETPELQDWMATAGLRVVSTAAFDELSEVIAVRP